jgi:6,7-dimethyl-8-ribityllumazine synthase
MATVHHNLSNYNPNEMPDASGMKVGIVVAEWNQEITSNLLKGALNTFVELGVKAENITLNHVPGSFELALGAQLQLENTDVDGVVVLGSVIQGETRHFEFVCQAVAMGIKDLNIKYNQPVIFGLLTDDSLQQAIDRSGGKHGNKGIECAVALVKMIALKKSLSA